MGGYLTQAGYLDRTRLEKLLAKLGDLELQVLEERAKVCACVYVQAGYGDGAPVGCVWVPSAGLVRRCGVPFLRTESFKGHAGTV